MSMNYLSHAGRISSTCCRFPRLGALSLLCLAGTFWQDPAAGQDSASIIRKSGISNGLVVHVGLKDVNLLNSFARQKGFLVHGLTTGPRALEKMRSSIAEAGTSSNTHVQLVSDLRKLPFADHLVNLLIADLDALSGKGAGLEEITRVISPSPLGAAWIRKNGKWKLHSKPRSESMGEWRHHRMDPNGNMSTRDEGAVPGGFQWLSGPLFAMLGRKNSTIALVTAAGRNIYLTQNTNENIRPGKGGYYLIARDGYNGLPIWQVPWKGPNRGSGETSFSVVATAELVFGVNSGSPIALDAATGRQVRTYSCTGTGQIAVLGTTLVAHTAKGLSVFDIERAVPRWQVALAPGKKGDKKKAGWRAPRSIFALARGRVFFLSNPDQKLHCFALEDGKKQWQVNTPPSGSYRTFNFADESVVGVVHKKELEVYSSKNGSLLWKKNSGHGPRFSNLQQSGHYLTDEGVWLRVGRYDWDIISPQDGKVIREFRSGMASYKNGCQGAILSGNHVVASRAATFYNKKTSAKESSITFSRGGCGTGMVPANGLHYTIPHACACFGETIRGMMGLRGGQAIPPSNYRTALVSNTRAGKVNTKHEAAWSTFCGNNARASFSPTELSPKMRQTWKKQLVKVDDQLVSREWTLRSGAPITQAVLDRERVYVGLVNTHQLVALDSTDGETLWSYYADGRISASPTLYKGLCLFGDHAGFVHCVQADTGSLRWRLRAARSGEMIMAYGQLESPWPVLGGVLVERGVAVFLSGRADGADGGVTAFGVDPLTGKEIWRKPIEGKIGIAGHLTSGDKGVFAMGTVFDASNGNATGTAKLQDALIPGRVDLQDSSWAHIGLSQRKSISTRSFIGSGVEAQGHLVAFADRKGTPLVVSLGRNLQATGASKWSRDSRKLGFKPTSVILDNNIVIVSGTKADKGWVAFLSQQDGSEMGSFSLPAPPVHMGLAAGNQRLYISCTDGTLFSYGK